MSEPGSADLSALELDEVLQRNAAVAADVCQCDLAAIFLVSETSQLLHCVAMYPERRSIPAVPIDSETIWARVARHGQLEAAMGSDALLPEERRCFEPQQLGALMALPIVIGSRCLGTLLLGHAVGGQFRDDAVARGTRFAWSVASAVERANLYQEATQRVAELSLLHEVGRAFNESLELSEILDTCADRFVALLDASNCFILLREGDGLRGVAMNGVRRGELADVFVPDGEPSLASLAFRERRPILSADAEHDARANPRLVERFGEKSVLALPMLHRGRAIGVVVFDDTRSRRLFTPAEVERASLVASHLAAAVDNARLYEDLRRSYADLAHTQARLVQRERLAAVGELAAQVAHEVRNPLGAIFNAVGELRRRLGAKDEIGYLLGVLGEETERINRIVGDPLDFTRPMEVSLQLGLLPTTLADAERAVFGPLSLEIKREIGSGLDQVVLDPRLLRQALLNLFENAAQAMGGAGRVRIVAHVIEVSGRPWAEVVVEDSGPGVEQSMQQRVFEPFFTTKATGIGLGLAVVKRIAEAHEGEVSVARSSLGGAAFSFRWPAESAEAG